MLNFIRKIFRLRPFESLFAFFLEQGILNWIIVRLIPSNKLYSPNSLRTVVRNGINFKLDLSDYQDWIIFYHSTIDSSEDILPYIHKDAKTIIDIGGNIGQTSLYIANQFSNQSPKIISFEPFPDTYKKFIRNLDINPVFKQNIEVECLGLGKEESTLQMFKECATNSGGNRMVYQKADTSGGVEEITVTTLDKYLEHKQLNRVDFIKIDVEGYEFAVLEGATNTLEKLKPSLYVEVDNNNLIKQGSNSKELYEFLKSFGYSFTNVNSKEKINSYKDIDDIQHFDMFCEFKNN